MGSVSSDCVLSFRVEMKAEKDTKVVKNILIYSHTRFQLYQSHSMTALVLKSAKMSVNWVSVGILETLR